MISSKTKQEVEHFIRGPSGQLELLVSKVSDEHRKAWGVVCHPHPQFGGTMNNKVVTTLVKAFHHLGLATVRFNFRGIGRSEGQFDNGRGELDDLMAVIEWILEEKPTFDIWLAGFSFGAYIAALAAIKIPVSRLVLVAPPVDRNNMETLPAIVCPFIVVQGEEDEVVSPQAVFDWVANYQPQPTLIRFQKTGHFFHGKLIELRKEIEEALVK